MSILQANSAAGIQVKGSDRTEVLLIKNGEKSSITGLTSTKNIEIGNTTDQLVLRNSPASESSTISVGAQGAASTLTIPTVGTSNFLMSVGNQSMSGIQTLSNTTDSTSSTSGGLIVSGGMGVAKKAYFNDEVHINDAKIMHAGEINIDKIEIGPYAADMPKLYVADGDAAYGCIALFNGVTVPSGGNGLSTFTFGCGGTGSGAVGFTYDATKTAGTLDI